MKTLIGHLSQFSVLSKQGELLCTQGLHFILENEVLRRVFESHIGEIASFKIEEDLSWHAEATQTDGGRPDLEGRSPTGRPVIKIEAKLHAAFGTGQLASYSQSLSEYPENSLLVVLVPRYRSAEARESIVEAGFADSQLLRKASAPHVCSAIITWEGVFDCLRHAADAFAQGDLRQFEGLYRTVGGEHLEPIAGTAVLKQWRIRDDFFANIVDRVTRKLWEAQGDAKVPPMRDFENNGYLLRYVPVKEWHLDKSSWAPHFCLGVRDPFSGSETPLWMRFHKKTPRFSEIRSRLLKTEYGHELRHVEYGGHFWIPLIPPFEVSGDLLIADLFNQVQNVLKSVAL